MKNKMEDPLKIRGFPCGSDSKESVCNARDLASIPGSAPLEKGMAMHANILAWRIPWSFSFNISPSNEHPGLISFRMDWLDLLAVHQTLKGLLQHHSSKASILWHSVFFIVQLSHPYMTTGKTIALTRQTFVDKRTTVWSNNSTSGNISKGNKNIYSKHICGPVFMEALFSVTRTWKELKYPSMNEWIKKLWYTCSM